MESTLEPTPTTKRASRRARTRKRDGRAIQSIFPGIRSLVFLGMWDPHQERWFGASIAVSYSSMRIFSVQSELSYIAAFCDVVLAEIWRLEAQELGRSKNDFVSSISHELRSPLGMICETTKLPRRSADNSFSMFLCSFTPLGCSWSACLEAFGAATGHELAYDLSGRTSAITTHG